MNPIDWLQDNIFYTDAKTKQINDAMRRNAGGEPTAYAAHAGTTYYQLPDGRDVYQTQDGQTYDLANGQQVALMNTTGESGVHDGAFSRVGNGYNAYKGTNLRNEDNQVIQEGGQVWKVPDSLDTGGGGGGNRNSSRVIPGSGGKVQKGTDMSRSFNDLLATTNTSGYQPFGSNQLPTTAGSPDAAVSPKTQQILAGIQAGKKTDMSIEGYKAPAYTAIQPDSPQFAEAFGQDLADKYKSAADSKVTGYTKGGRLDQALNDTAGMQSYMSKFSSGDRERAANRAFLDTEKSMEALRAKEAVNGVVYAQQQHYIAGSDADGPAKKITRDQARDISNGKSTAAGLLETYKNRITEAQKDTPAESQDPLSAAGSAVKSGFAAGAKTDFALNNNSGGADKPGQKTIDSNFMESVDFSDPTQLAEYERRMNQLK